MLSGQLFDGFSKFINIIKVLRVIFIYLCYWALKLTIYESMLYTEKYALLTKIIDLFARLFVYFMFQKLRCQQNSFTSMYSLY